jgi:hypothetical protein
MLVVNLFAGPGAGKSTMAAAVFANLKANGVMAELVSEFAKECAWEGREGPLKCQPYVFGEQLWRLERLRDRDVEIAVTDSPILLSRQFMPDTDPDEFFDAVLAYHKRQTRLNVVLTRVKPYDTRGRFQNAAEAQALDVLIRHDLEKNDRIDCEVPGDPENAPMIAWRARQMAGLLPQYPTDEEVL